MPLYYQFINGDNEIVPLDKIDEELCAELGSHCPENVYSQEFELLTMVGEYSFRDGEFCTSAFIFACTTLHNDQMAVFFDFLNGKYKYRSWRGSRT